MRPAEARNRRLRCEIELSVWERAVNVSILRAVCKRSDRDGASSRIIGCLGRSGMATEWCPVAGEKR